MKITKDQSGIAHLALILVVVLIATVGFAGWRVYQRNNPIKRTTTNKPTDNSSNLDEEPVDFKDICDLKVDNKPSTFTGAMTEFNNSTVGIKFSYPQAWGEATISPGPESEHLIAGSEYKITFSKNKDVEAGLTSADWKHDPNRGHGGLVYAGARAKSDCKDFSEQFEVIQYKDTNSIISSEELDGESCHGTGNTLAHKFEGNPRYPGIAFLYYDTYADEHGKCQDYKTVISEEHISELKAIIPTLKLL